LVEGKLMSEPERLSVLAVLGPGTSSSELDRVAAAVGRLAAKRGWVVLTGGGPGVMAAASRGAYEAGGLTVGILPCSQANSAYPNQWVKLPIYTGAGMARNAFNVLSAELCVALGGGPGTLSEVALALKASIPIWCWQSWQLTPPPTATTQQPRCFNTEEELMKELGRRLGS
jgi:uncharacterized protein (TIGR00725 family)